MGKSDYTIIYIFCKREREREGQREIENSGVPDVLCFLHALATVLQLRMTGNVHQLW
jgi:hypothetical protein